MSDDILTVRNLKKYFVIQAGFLSTKKLVVKAVDGVSFSLKRGETLGLVGESGCGKSTVARMILLLEKPSAGDIIFEKENITRLNGNSLRKLRRNIQIIFQDPYSSLNPRKSIKSILSEPFIIHRLLPRNQIKNKVVELMEKVGLNSEQLNRFPHEFSSGQRQRVGIARALTLNPKLVIADEPVSALDVSIRAQMLNLLTDLQQEFNLTYLFISHDLSVVRHISNRVAVMYLGKLVEVAGSEELYQNPLHPYTRALLSAAPIPDPEVKKKRIILSGDIPTPINPPQGCYFSTRCPLNKKEDCFSMHPELREVKDQHWVACYLQY
jgi:oligopeptide/dipeptide ABC transporter ATP-binding protein